MDKSDVENRTGNDTKRLFVIRNDGTGRNMKCVRVAKQIQVRPSNGNCTRRTYGSKFIYSTARDRRSLISASDANTEQRGVSLFAIASHLHSTIAVRSKHNQLESLYLYRITLYTEYLGK